jgi:hypothetical protein
MNSRTTHGGLCSSFGLGWCVLVMASTAMAQQRYYPQPQGGYPQQQQYSPPPGYQQQPPTQYENPLQFLPKFGQRMSEMVRRLFYGQQASGYNAPPPGPDYGQNGGYSLDSSPRPQQSAPNYPQQYPIPGRGYVPQQPQGSTQPPAGYQQQPGYQYPQQQQAQEQEQPRHSNPQQQAAQPRSQQQAAPPPKRSTTPAPTTQSKSSTSTSNNTKKYSPPKVNESPPARTTTSKPPTVTPKKEPKPDAPPPTATTRRSESTPKEFPTTTSSGASGSFLKGKKTAKPGRVISPYPPYKELDITGLESGSLALDPTTQKVFEVP